MTRPYRIRFGAATGRRSRARDEVQAWLAELVRDGVLAEARIVGEDARGWFAWVAASADAVPATLVGPRGFAAAPRWQLAGRTCGTEPIALARTRRLLLWSGWLEAEPPLRDFASGRPVRWSEVGDRELRQGLVHWARTFQACDGLWFGCGVLERAAAAELSRPRSRLQRDARRLAAEVEAASGRPTYHYLVRTDDAEPASGCPRCGASWRRRRHGAWNFIRRCDPCRLVAHGTAPRRS